MLALSSSQGKTDVALLTILRCLSSLASTPLTSMSDPPKLPPASQYKIIYVAPLKALAAEITQKFAKRLAWAGVKCRELTGDMKMTKKEVEETGVIVTTPEKWDVVTRKGAGSGDGEVAEVKRFSLSHSRSSKTDQTRSLLQNRKSSCSSSMRFICCTKIEVL